MLTMRIDLISSGVWEDCNDFDCDINVCVSTRDYRNRDFIEDYGTNNRKFASRKKLSQGSKREIKNDVLMAFKV